MSELDRARQIIAAMRERKPIYIDGRFSDPMLSGLLSSACAATADAGISVVFNHDRSKPQLDLLVDGTVDLLIDIQPVQNLDKHGIERRLLFSRPLVAIVDKAHPLAACDSITVSELSPYTLVRMMSSDCDSGWDKIVSLCRDSGFDPHCKTISVRTMTEGIVMAPRDCVLLYPGATKELKFLAGAHKTAVPVLGDRTAFGTYAMYRRENEERVSSFVNALVRMYADFENEGDGGKEV